MSLPLRIFGLASDSIVDGPGLRFGVFVQGCSHACPGCHNPESHDSAAGDATTVDAVMEAILANRLVTGVTLSGGEPFEQAAACAEIGRRCREAGLDVWTYTGYTYEKLLETALAAAPVAASLGRPQLDPAGVRDLLAVTDVLVDGPFVESLKALGLSWRGSSNQRVIDLAATRTSGQVVPWSHHEDFPEKPSNW